MGTCSGLSRERLALIMYEAESRELRVMLRFPDSV